MTALVIALPARRAKVVELGGIPAVVNVGPATRVIRTGQLIRVDGDRGEVSILDEPVGADYCASPPADGATTTLGSMPADLSASRID